MSLSRKEIKEAREDKAYWQVLAAFLSDWQLMGWTYRQRAVYTTPSMYIENGEDTIQISGRQCDDLIAAFEREYERGFNAGRFHNH